MLSVFLVRFAQFCPIYLCLPSSPISLSLYILPCVLQCLWGHEIAPQLLGISCAFLLRLPSLTHCLLCLSVFVYLSFVLLLHFTFSEKIILYLCLCIFLSLPLFKKKKFQPSQCTVGPVHRNINMMDGRSN